VADGIVVNWSLDASITDVTLEDNGRVGLFVDACSEPRTLPQLDRVLVTGRGDQLGAYAHVTLPTGESTLAAADWDTGITRLGSTSTNDAMGVPLPGWETGCPPCVAPGTVCPP
jgi:hypothetical protein